MSTDLVPAGKPGTRTTPPAPGPRIVDADVHNAVSDVHNTRSSLDVLTRYMPDRWARQVEMYGIRYPQSGGYMPRPRPFVARTDSWPPDGGVPGGDVDFMRQQLLDRWGIDAAILNPIDMTTFGGQVGDLANALTRALNDWTLEEWLLRDERLWGSICVAYEMPEYAVAEIERLGDHPRFIQVLINQRTREPIGSRRYWPMFEAAVAYNLPISMHVGGHGSDDVSGAGWPTYGMEDHAGLPQAYQTQVTSLIANGVFERFPTLKFVLQEGGFGWLPSLMWRLDMAWELLGDEVPEVTRPPSEVIREHFWFTTQPIEEPERPDYFTQLMQDMGMDDRALFATDYPHWDFDAPDHSLPRSLDEKLRRKIFSGNAVALYPQLLGNR